MGQWIKDSTLLWIKNKGAGQAASEEDIDNLKEKEEYEAEKESLV